MGDLVSGAVVGAAFAELLGVVKEALKTTLLFRSRLTSLQRVLLYIGPIFKEIDSLNDQLDRPKEEMAWLHDLMENGKILVKKSSSITTNVWKRYRCSKKLAELEDDIVKFFQFYTIVISRDNKEGLVDLKDILAGIRKVSLMIEGGYSNKGTRPESYESIAVPKAPEFVVGLNVSIQKLKAQLLARGVSAIVVSAPGGCGKTTLVKTLCHSWEIKDKFKNNIFFVTVSQSPNFTVIVQSMFHHKGGDVPRIETEEQGFDQLQLLLVKIGKDPVLLVLDDVWPESEKSFLEKFKCDEIKDYKILVTSRYELSSFGTLHKLDPLNHEDARKLFIQSAIPKVGRSTLPGDDLIDEIVKRCKGSPLALTVVGKSLCGKHPEIWKSKLLNWSEGLFVDSNKAIFDCLRRSLDDLDERQKEAFMDLGSFPEDHSVPATVLIDMWIELHDLDMDGVHARGILRELAAGNLIDLVETKSTKNDEGEGDGFYNDLYVRQHDLLRELAIHQNNQGPIHERERLNLDIRQNEFPKWCTLPKEQSLDARLLSISTDDKFSSCWPHLELPSAEVLVINFRTNNYTLPPFIENMVSLKTLIITNNGFFPAELSNFTILGSLPNLRRIRFERIKIPSFAPSDVNMSNLHKASFFMCDLRDMPASAMPNLEEIDISYCSELESLPADLCDVKSLKKISITSCHNLSSLPDQIGNLVNLQMLRLNSCLGLSGLPESVGRLQELAFLDISDCFSIKKLPDEIGKLCRLKKLHMKGCSGLSAIPETVVNLDQLKLVICDAQRAHLWRSYKPRLRKMTVKIVQEDVSLNWLLK